MLLLHRPKEGTMELIDSSASPTSTPGAPSRKYYSMHLSLSLPLPPSQGRVFPLLKIVRFTL